MKKLILLGVIMTIVATTQAADPIKIAADFISLNEGFRANTYTCVAGKPTIGYGFTSKALVAKGSITRKEADAILYNYAKACMKVVNEHVKVKLTNNQKAVLCDFIYHFGKQAFLDSTLLKNINGGKSMDSICYELSRWKYAKVNGRKVEVTGLINRCNRLINLYKA